MDNNLICLLLSSSSFYLFVSYWFQLSIICDFYESCN